MYRTLIINLKIGFLGFGHLLNLCFENSYFRMKSSYFLLHILEPWQLFFIVEFWEVDFAFRRNSIFVHFSICWIDIGFGLRFRRFIDSTCWSFSWQYLANEALSGVEGIKVKWSLVKSIRELVCHMRVHIHRVGRYFLI